MRPWSFLAVLLVCECVAGGSLAADDTQATSRLVTVYFDPIPSNTRAVSRLVSVYQSNVLPSTVVISRLVTAYLPPDAISTRAVSHPVTAWVGFSLPNAIASLRIAAGLQSATAREEQLYNLVTSASSANVIDILDAYRIAIYAIHPERLP